jgi:hypothetical protein
MLHALQPPNPITQTPFKLSGPWTPLPEDPTKPRFLSIGKQLSELGGRDDFPPPPPQPYRGYKLSKQVLGMEHAGLSHLYYSLCLDPETEDAQLLLERRRDLYLDRYINFSTLTRTAGLRLFEH